MFTGLIQNKVAVLSINGNQEGLNLVIARPTRAKTPQAPPDALPKSPVEKAVDSINSKSPDDFQLGESIAIDGACLTVTKFDDHALHFFVGQETLVKTTLGGLVKNQLVNFERSLALGDRLGGHLVSGHVDGTGTISGAMMRGPCLWLRVVVSLDQLKLIIPKGSVALNGVSLTVNTLNRDDNSFEVLLIPETLARTNLAGCAVGDSVNIECDQMVKTIVHHLSFLSNQGHGGLREFS